MSDEGRAKEFEFYNYVFSSNTLLLKEYLLEQNVNYKIIDNQIFFKLQNEYCEEDILVSATFENDKITRMQLKCYPKSFNNKKAIESYLDSQYKFIKRDYSIMSRIYESDDYTIVAKNPDSILIDVQFDPVLYVEEKEKKVRLKKIFLFTIIGICLSTLFITLYFIYKSTIVLNIITILISVFFALFQFEYIYIRKALISERFKISLRIIVPFIYMILMVVLFFLVFVRVGIDIDSETRGSLIDFLFIILYLSPSFHLCLLLLVGMLYA